MEKIAKYIKHVKVISGQEKYDYYMSSDIFVLPSYAENMPNVLLEAMAAGLPVVVSNVGANPEIVEDGVNGFIIKPGDINAIADRIVKLAEDSNLRKSMGQINLKLAKEKYDMSIVAEKIDKLYQGLL
jgi:glycosyltransferase involved in cell wall biosynthesis